VGLYKGAILKTPPLFIKDVCVTSFIMWVYEFFTKQEIYLILKKYYAKYGGLGHVNEINEEKATPEMKALFRKYTIYSESEFCPL